MTDGHRGYAIAKHRNRLRGTQIHQNEEHNRHEGFGNCTPLTWYDQNKQMRRASVTPEHHTTLWAAEPSPASPNSHPRPSHRPQSCQWAWTAPTKGLTISANAAPDVSCASNNPTVTCRRTQPSSMKFTTKAKVSQPVRDIHKSKVIEAVWQLSMSGVTNRSIVLVSIAGICSRTNCFRLGQTTFGSLRIISLRSHADSTILRDSYPLAMNKTRSSRNRCCCTSFFA